MPVEFSKNRILGRAQRMLEAGASDETIVQAIKKRNKGLSPAVWAMLIQLLMEFIKNWRTKNKGLPGKKKFHR